MTEPTIDGDLPAIRIAQLTVALEQSTKAQLENYHMATRAWTAHKEMENAITQLEERIKALKQNLVFAEEASLTFAEETDKAQARIEELERNLQGPIAYMRNEGTPNNVVQCTFSCPGAFPVYKINKAPQ